MIGIGVDGANVMVGKYNSVTAIFKRDLPRDNPILVNTSKYSILFIRYQLQMALKQSFDTYSVSKQKYLVSNRITRVIIKKYSCCRTHRIEWVSESPLARLSVTQDTIGRVRVTWRVTWLAPSEPSGADQRRDSPIEKQKAGSHCCLFFVSLFKHTRDCLRLRVI